MNDDNQSTVNDTRQAASSKSAIDRTNEVKNKYKKSKKALSVLKFVNAKLFATIAPIIAAIAIVILIIFLIAGFVGYFITLPGLAVAKIKDTGKNFVKWAIGYEGVEVSAEEINSLADYVNGMGYDIVGYGFAKSSQVKTKKNESTGEDEFDRIFTDEELKEEDSVTTSVSQSNLYAYILASERTYATSGTKINYAGEYVKIASSFDKIFYFGYTLITNAMQKRYNAWDGMLVFDELNNIDKLKYKIDIDRANEKMVVDTGIINKNRMTWDLSGWTSRYGKPIELSLAWHLSTMAPDFVYNFCMDDDLQTKVILGTNDVNITNLKYKYQKEGGQPVSSDEVLEVYEKFDKENSKYTEMKQRLFPNKNTVDLGVDENFYAPVDVLTDTNIISIKDTNTGVKRYYKAVDSNKQPVSFDFGDPSKTKFNFNINENGEPSFEQNNNGNINIVNFLLNTNSEIDIGDDKVLCMEVLSFNDLKQFVTNPPFDDAEGQQYTEIGIQEFTGKISSDWTQYKFVNGDTYNDTMIYLDTYIKKIIDEKDNLNIELTLKHCNNIKENDFTEWNFKSEEKYKGHNAKDTWNKIKDDATKENFKTLIDNFSSWINDEVKQLNNNNVEIENMLVGKVRDLLEKGNLTYDEFKDLVKVFEDFTKNKEISTFEPYIKSVTHHWRRDLFFETDDWSAYKEQVGRYYGGEFEGVELTYQNLVDKLEESGTFFYSGTSDNSISQQFDPKIVTTAPWHYKMKNWVKYGYYFIYDGNQSTAKEIERAKEFLAKKVNKNDVTYDSSNPLLLDKYKSAELKTADTQKNLYESSVDLEEINKTAEALNDRLENAGYNVRLQQISFDKDASLSAFSILESVHTEDADLIYRDLKEFLIELKYFTEEDFEKIETDVLEWLIPDYTVYKDEWPDSKYERLDTEYGAYIRSKLSLDTQKEKEGVKRKASDYAPQSGEEGILAVGKKCWEYIVNHSERFTYAQVGIQIPITDQTTTIDCSSFISWVLYEYGYEDFKGGQQSTDSLLNTNFNSRYGWTEIMVNGDATSLIKPGDILVRPGHVTLIKSIDSNGRVMTYNCGDTSHWAKENLVRGVDQTVFVQQSGTGKIIRVNKAGSSYTSASFRLEKNSSNTTTTAGVEETKVDASDYEEEGFATVTTVNGISYKNYKQGTYPYMGVSSTYSQMYLPGCSGPKGSFGWVGCGPTSTAVVLSAYGITGKTGENALPFVCGKLEGTHNGGTNTCENIKLAFDNYNIPATVYTVSSDAKDKIDNALREGRPVIANVHGNYYSPGGHYIAILGYDSDNKLVISNPCGSGIYGVAGHSVTGPVTLDYFVNNCLGGGSNQYLIPDEVPQKGNLSASESLLQEVVGYESGLDIIMPETGKIIEIGKVKENTKNESQESKTSEDTTSEDTTNSSHTEVTTNPNDNSRSDYIVTKGDYILIEFETNNGVNGWKMRIEGFDLDTVNVQEGVTLQKGDVIGITNEYNMKLILYDTQDAIMNNIQDYFVLQERDRRTRSNISNNQYEFFYFVIYESGVLTAEGNGPESVGACRPGIEHGVGICQWTSTTDGLSNIQKVCENLYNLDNDLCKPLQKYIGMDSVTLINQYAMQPSFENSILKQDFQSICERDRERFLELQMQIAMEEKYEIFEDLGLSWVRERPLAVQGTLASLVNWGSACGWENVINQSMSDEDIIINLLRHACTIPSTVGYLNSRWNPQAKAAIDILHGEIDAERFCKEIEYSAPYSTGTNGDFLSTQ